MLGKDSAGRHVPTSGTSLSMEEAVCAWWWLILCPEKVHPHGEDLSWLQWWEACAVESNKLSAVKRNIIAQSHDGSDNNCTMHLLPVPLQ